MAPAPHGIEIPPAEIEIFCARNRIRKLSLFGSILTDRFGPESDVDVLVEFEPGAAITFLDVVRMEREFADVQTDNLLHSVGRHHRYAQSVERSLTVAALLRSARVSKRSRPSGSIAASA